MNGPSTKPFLSKVLYVPGQGSHQSSHWNATNLECPALEIYGTLQASVVNKGTGNISPSPLSSRKWRRLQVIWKQIPSLLLGRMNCLPFLRSYMILEYLFCCLSSWLLLANKHCVFPGFPLPVDSSYHFSQVQHLVMDLTDHSYLQWCFVQDSPYLLQEPQSLVWGETAPRPKQMGK